VDLLHGANLNNLVISGNNGDQQLIPGTHFGNGWVVGPYNQGIHIFDKTNDGIAGATNDPGVSSGVRLMHNDAPGSVYFALGTLKKDQVSLTRIFYAIFKYEVSGTDVPRF